MAAAGFEIGGQEKGAAWSNGDRQMCIRRWKERGVGGERDGRRWAARASGEVGRARVSAQSIAEVFF